jgi:DnaK suppressor protein
MNTTKEMRRYLNQELNELRMQIAQRSDLLVHRAPDAFDNSLLMAARETAMDFLVQRSAKLREVEEALDRIRRGSYGKCEECQSPIGERRLRALPSARACISCQSLFEGQFYEPVRAEQFTQAA